MRREPPVRIREGLGVKLPRATRLVIGCRATAAEARERMRAMRTRLKLTVKETKTRACHLPEETFDFLGSSFGRISDRRTGPSSVGARPSWTKIHRLGREISDRTARSTLQLSVADQVARRNRTLRGWWNDFRHGTVSRADQVVNNHAEERLRRW
jgi:hypothetical protein